MVLFCRRAGRTSGRAQQGWLGSGQDGAAGAAIGAYTGSLAGAVNRMGEDTPAVEIPARPAGVRLAVHVSSPAQEPEIVSAFRRHDVRSIEEAEGTWRDGWSDFDPVSVPHWLEAPTQHLAP